MAYQGEGGLPDIKQRIYRERGSVVLDAGGDATITFANPIPASADGPFLHLTPWVDGGDDPVIANPISSSWATDGNGNYLSVDIHGERTQNLPASILNLGALQGRRVTVDTDVTGVVVDWMVF